MSMRIGRRLLGAVLVLSLAGEARVAAQQPSATGVAVSVAADRPDAIYKCGEKATFLVTVTDGGQPATTGEVAVMLKRDLAEQVDKQTLALGKDPVKVTGTLAQPGFLHCEAVFTRDGKSVKGLASAAFDPLSIKPACSMPATPPISIAPSPHNRQSSRAAISLSFIDSGYRRGPR